MRKDAFGRIILKENWFLKYFWGGNFWRWLICRKIGFAVTERYDEEDPKYPSSICTLFWGSVLAPLLWIWTLFVGLVIILAMILILVIAFIFGFMPKTISDGEALFEVIGFHGYKRHGKHDEKKHTFAPYQIILTGFVIWLLVVDGFAVSRHIGMFFQLPVSWIMTGSIVLIVVLILFLRSTAGKVTVEFLKAKKEKACPLITIEKKQ